MILEKSNDQDQIKLDYAPREGCNQLIDKKTKKKKKEFQLCQERMFNYLNLFLQITCSIFIYVKHLFMRKQNIKQFIILNPPCFRKKSNKSI